MGASINAQPTRFGERRGIARIGFDLARPRAIHWRIIRVRYNHLMAQLLEVLPGLSPVKYPPIKAVHFHTRTTSKLYGDDYAV